MKNAILLNLILCTSLSSFAVINGQTADPALSAATVTFKLSQGARQCSGVIVHPHLIFTAGHCTEGASNNSAIEVTNAKNNKKTTSSRVTWKVAPGYTESETKDAKDIQKDFAFIVTAKDLVQELGIDPAQVPKVAFSAEEVKAALNATANQATGYGYGIYDVGGRDGIKNELQVTVSLDATNNVYWTQGVTPLSGVCPGDSGGGIFARAENGRPLLLGNLSGITKACGKADSRGAYTIAYNQVCWAQQKSKIDLGATCP